MLRLAAKSSSTQATAEVDVTGIEVDAIDGSLPYAFYGMVSVEHTRHNLKNPGVNYRHSIRRKEGLEEGYAVMLLTKDFWKGMEDECPHDGALVVMCQIINGFTRHTGRIEWHGIGDTPIGMRNYVFVVPHRGSPRSCPSLHNRHSITRSQLPTHRQGF